MNTLIPIFLGLLLVECAYSWWRGTGWYSLPDSIANVSAAAVMALTVDYFEPSADVYGWLEQHVSTGWLRESSWVKLVIAFVALDFILYWIHRYAHKFGILWAIHEVHHQSEYMNYSVALRQSSFLFVNSWLFLAPYAVAGFSGVVLMQVHVVSLLYQFVTHTEAFSRIRWLDFVFVMPVHHRVHHASNDAYIDKNFGSVLIVWDRLFGTFVEERPDVQIRYGVRRPLETWSPIEANLIGFRDWWRALSRRVVPSFRRPANRRVGGEQEYDTTRFATGYGVMQFLACMALLIEFMFQLSGGYVVSVEVELAILVLSFLLVPGTFDRGLQWRSIEYLRLALLSGAGAVGLLAASEPLALSCAVVAWAALSFVALGVSRFVIQERV